jgi:maltose O-acetyltransferase
MQLLNKIIDVIERFYRKRKSAIIRSRLKACGSNVKIDATCFIVIPEQLEVGNNTLIAPYTVIFATFGVKIGENCLISSNCGISSYNHVQNSINRPADHLHDKEYSKPVVIGNNVWIGMNVNVLPGVTIGNNSIVGSGSVVTKSIPDNEIWFGNPARFFKRIDI